MKQIGEKAKKWEVKSHGCWPSLPLISPYFFTLTHSQSQGGGEHYIRNCRKKNVEHHSKLVFLIEFQGKKKVGLNVFFFSFV